MKTRINNILIAALIVFSFLSINVKAEGAEITLASYIELSEPALEMEEWMLDDGLFVNEEIELNENIIEEYNELEEWMIDDTFFEFETIEVNNSTETELEIESWMFNNNFLGFE